MREYSNQDEIDRYRIEVVREYMMRHAPPGSRIAKGRFLLHSEIRLARKGLFGKDEQKKSNDKDFQS